ncbi:hypothetical protein P691DRAFT_758085 [Macrolepiota fuliginosa MF-IS2]|uniref:Uncharacterized protein n=1 Tax=Macrolepiota fuliginosa MF-IS2 TaxID=1400762 RepID=A0A9P6C681_9AGAR|nr:hypothetical protein P691DRAFT_758085 [Macrolepiota fuliginosa MF-IS2]
MSNRWWEKRRREKVTARNAPSPPNQQQRNVHRVKGGEDTEDMASASGSRDCATPGDPHRVTLWRILSVIFGLELNEVLMDSTRGIPLGGLVSLHNRVLALPAAVRYSNGGRRMLMNADSNVFFLQEQRASMLAGQYLRSTSLFLPVLEAQILGFFIILITCPRDRFIYQYTWWLVILSLCGVLIIRKATPEFEEVRRRGTTPFGTGLLFGLHPDAQISTRWRTSFVINIGVWWLNLAVLGGISSFFLVTWLDLASPPRTLVAMLVLDATTVLLTFLILVLLSLTIDSCYRLRDSRSSV